MERGRARRYVVAALAVVVVLLGVDRCRGDGGGAAKAPVRPTTTVAYVPAVIRGDPVPVVHAPDGVRAARAGSRLTGLTLSAPGAKPDDVLGVFVVASGARIELPATEGVKTYPVKFPSWQYFEGTLTAVNAALAALHYVPTPGGKQELFLGMMNTTLHTNARTATVPVQVT